MIGFLIAVISGLLMSVQGVFNTQVTKTTGMWVANAFVQFTAFLVCIAIWAISDRTSIGTLLKVEPRYMLIGGILGAGITYTVIKAMDMMGPAKAVMMIVTAQILVAYLIELFGLFGVEKQPFSWRKVIGILLAAGGIILFKWAQITLVKMRQLHYNDSSGQEAFPEREDHETFYKILSGSRLTWHDNFVCSGLCRTEQHDLFLKRGTALGGGRCRRSTRNERHCIECGRNE